MQHSCQKEDIFEVIDKRISRMEICVFGNGRSGLSERVAAVENAIANNNKIVYKILNLFLSVVSAALTGYVVSR